MGKITTILSELKKSFYHQYIKREGTPGHYKYFYNMPQENKKDSAIHSFINDMLKYTAEYHNEEAERVKRERPEVAEQQINEKHNFN